MSAVGERRSRIWIDLDNTPHIPFFKPIIRELKARGHDVVVSARDAYQVCDVADQAGLEYVRVGRHYGKNPVRKVWGTAWRAAQLLPFFLRFRPQLAVSHGSRSQIILSTLARIPSVLLMDYEFSRGFPLAHPRWVIVPDALSREPAFVDRPRTLVYEGLKEDVYVPEFRPDDAIRASLGLDPAAIVVTVRPPATEAHYHNPEGERLLVALMDWLVASPGVQIVLLPRNQRQDHELRRAWPAWFASPRVIVPREAIDGLNLLWHSDLVVSGGGTMNREAAALDIPVYSIFRGHIGAVDRRLAEQGRLVLIENAEQLHQKVLVRRRARSADPGRAPRPALRHIVDHIERIAREDR